MNDGALAGDEALAGARGHDGAGDALDAVDGDEDGAGVEGVGDVEGGGDAVVVHGGVGGPLDGVDLDEADLGDGVEEAGGDDFAAAVDQPGTGRDDDVDADGPDLAVFNPQVGFFESPLGTHGVNGGADDADTFGHGRGQGLGDGGEGGRGEENGEELVHCMASASRIPSSKSISGWRAGLERSKTRAPSM